MFYLYKLIFLTILFLGTMITMSSQSWMGIWMGLEINLLSFIPLISMKNNSLSTESSIKYFLSQALASSIFLFSIMMIIMKNKFSNDLIMFNQSFLLMLNSSILLKLGAAPFHFWFPEIINGLNWMNSMILMTWQKIAPMIILSYSMKMNMFIYLVIIFSAFIGSIGGINQMSLRKILAYSSINHISWMLSAMLINESMFFMYFLIYSILSMSIIMMFNMFKFFTLKQIYSMNNSYFIKFFLFLNLLSLAGLPPFLGFLPKWMIIQLMSTNNFFMIFFMIMMSLITLFFYLRIMYSSIMIANNEMNFMLFNLSNLNKLLINLLSFISIFSLILYSIMFNFF
uniref:NADH-ubiquinone oxidoreductase chain 2 n=2 Tax=unclassified Desmopachria TaxID=2640228 RepID=A0A873QJA8_9DYTI|nr:NADH dehydrogenase subunit 2 [Desmopachria sp. ITV9392]QPA36184.1 NADH dehydrogenase subunit 2 [Desmopachria sp. RRMO-2020]QPA36197.1 NADH dehydrogenase subunit 2 [Desmopachria sp. RRMO-2020]QPA36210.1 NADH dehydrogenase subunit 2 [Desmopachria sp. RRMO-2020]QPA36223.1 NADH dehydrogenase subunit 2 [Desmopachria sp. RRMO-2020]